MTFFDFVEFLRLVCICINFLSQFKGNCFVFGAVNGPVALGRKNYLFAGSHDAAQRAAMIYSFFAICKKYEVNPFQWLKHTLQNITQA